MATIESNNVDTWEEEKEMAWALPESVKEIIRAFPKKKRFLEIARGDSGPGLSADDPDYEAKEKAMEQECKVANDELGKIRKALEKKILAGGGKINGGIWHFAATISWLGYEESNIQARKFEERLKKPLSPEAKARWAARAKRLGWGTEK